MMKFLLLFFWWIPFSLPAEGAHWFHGTWMTVSHQTIQVFHYRNDGTFSSTYFTPALDVKSVMEGTWRLEKGRLHTVYEKSDLPFMKTPYHDEDLVEQVDENQFKVTGVRMPIRLVFNRVQFKDPRDVMLVRTPPPKELPPKVPPPGLGDLRAFTEEDMWKRNKLWDYIFSRIQHAPGKLFDEKVRHVVDHELSEAAGYYYVTEVFYGMYGNAGLSNVLLFEADELEFQKWKLEKVRDGFRYFGCKGQARFVDSQLKHVDKWANEIARLIELEKQGVAVPETEYEKVWGHLEALEPTWERIRDNDPFLYDQVLKDLKAHPERYLKKTAENDLQR